LNGKIGFPGGKPNGTGLSIQNFSKKREYLQRYSSFLVFIGITGKSLWRPPSIVSVPNIRLDAFMGHRCTTSGEKIFINFNVFPYMKLISVWLANMPVLDARIYRFFTHYFAV